MSRNHLSTLGRTLLAALFLVGPQTASAARGAEEPPDRLALLVGLDRYAQGELSPRPLAGAKRDVQRARDVLTDRFGFEAPNIRLLVDEQATKEAIVRAFYEHLILRAGRDTEVVFWFSGHGSRVPDTSGRHAESEGLDSSLIAFDSRAGDHQGSFDLVDDELGALLEALSRRTNRVLAVLDTCHSGGGYRGEDVDPVRLAPEGRAAPDLADLPSFWPSSVPLEDDSDWADVRAGGFAFIGACRSNERAHEIRIGAPGEESRFQGLFSWALLNEMDRAQPGTTLRDVVDRVRATVSRRRIDQTVSAAGALDRLLFKGDFQAPPEGFFARTTVGDELLLEAGQLHFVHAGAALRMLDGSGRNLGRARVLSAGPTRARARWESSVEVESGRALRAVLEGTPIGVTPLPVHTQVSELAERLAGWPEAYAVSDPRAAYRLSVGEAGELFLTDPFGMAIPMEEGPQGLRDVFKSELLWRELFELSAPREGLVGVEVQVRSPTPEEVARESLPGVRVDPDSDDGVSVHLKPGEHHLAILEVSSSCDQDVYVALLDVSQDRSIAQLVRGAPLDEPLRPGAHSTVAIKLLLPSSWPVDLPLQDRVLALVTRSRADFSALEQKARYRGPSELPNFLRQAMGGRSRSGRKAVASWGLVSLDLFLRPEDAER